MKTAALCILAGLVLAGCQPVPSPSAENPMTQNTESLEPEINIELKTPEPDDRFKAIVLGNVFYLSDADAKKFNLDEDKAKSEFEKIPTGVRTSKLLALRKAVETTDLKVAAAKLLAESPSEVNAYKTILLKVPQAFLQAHNGLEQAPEFWGDLMAELYNKTRDKDVLDSLFSQDMDGAAAETIAHSRIAVVLSEPERVLPLLSDKHIETFAMSFDIGSDDPDQDKESIALLAQSENHEIAAVAQKILKAIGNPSESPDAQG